MLDIHDLKREDWIVLLEYLKEEKYLNPDGVFELAKLKKSFGMGVGK